MASVSSDDPRRSSYGRDYWLRRCEGFRVDAPDGRIGVVRGIRFGARSQPELLEVRAGVLGRRLFLIAVGEVERIDSQQRRIVLSGSPRLVSSERDHSGA